MLKNFRSYQLAKELYRECQKQPMLAHERDQLLRASLSVCLNLAEGSGKLNQKDRKRFFGMAFASLRETQALLEIKELDTLSKTADHLAACIWKLHRKLEA